MLSKIQNLLAKSDVSILDNYAELPEDKCVYFNIHKRFIFSCHASIRFPFPIMI